MAVSLMLISTTVSLAKKKSAIAQAEVFVPPKTDLSNGLWLYGGSLCDIQITVGLSCLLYKKIGGFNSTTDTTLRQLIKLSLSTASYTSISALSVSNNSHLS